MSPPPASAADSSSPNVPCDTPSSRSTSAAATAHEPTMTPNTTNAAATGASVAAVRAGVAAAVSLTPAWSQNHGLAAVSSPLSRRGGSVEVEIGIGKSGRRAYGFDDIAIVPSRRTRDPEDVDISWEVDAYRFELPMMAAAMDGVVSPATAIEIGRIGGIA